jgi:hypothetical protein
MDMSHQNRHLELGQAYRGARGHSMGCQYFVHHLWQVTPQCPTHPHERTETRTSVCCHQVAPG